MGMFDKPIPGQSLTDAPRNAPWERPPEIVDPEEALMYHLDNLNDKERLQNAMFLLDYGVDLQTLVTGLTRAAVMDGIHSVDVSLIVAPVLHEFLKGNAEAVGVDFKEGFEEEGKKEKMDYARNTLMAKKKLEELGESDEEPLTLDRVSEEIAPETAETGEGEAPIEEQPMKKKGLMAREV